MKFPRGPTTVNARRNQGNLLFGDVRQDGRGLRGADETEQAGDTLFLDQRLRVLASR
jgi:hypothetical protein